MKFREWLLEKIGFEKYPRGWNRKSVIKFANTLTRETKKAPKDKGWFDACVDKMSGEMDDPRAFCAAVRDEALGTTKWRGKKKK